MSSSSPVEPKGVYSPRSAGQRLRASDWNQAVSGAQAELATHTHAPGSLSAAALAPQSSLSVAELHVQELIVSGEPLDKALRQAGELVGERKALGELLSPQGGRVRGDLSVQGDLSVLGDLKVGGGLKVAGQHIRGDEAQALAQIQTDETFHQRLSSSSRNTFFGGAGVLFQSIPQQWVEPVVQLKLSRSSTLWLFAYGGCNYEASYMVNAKTWGGSFLGEIAMLFGVQTAAGRWPLPHGPGSLVSPERRFEGTPGSESTQTWHRHALASGPLFSFHTAVTLPAGDYAVSAWVRGDSVQAPFAVQRLVVITLPPHQVTT